MRILGIETSCDETAAAVVEEGRTVLSTVVASQLATHSKYGGVVPELASREQLRAIVPVVRLALEQARTNLGDLAAVAVTEGPGLVGSLLVGITYAKALCFARGLPLIGVNHIEGHIHAVLLEAGEQIEFPALALVVSGGHTHLYEVREGFAYRLLGKTRDDAAGEAYDKVAKLLGFPYPGGPVIDQLAPYGDPEAVKFTLARMKGNALDFSFSGLKTAVLRWVEQHNMVDEIDARRHVPQPGARGLAAIDTASNARSAGLVSVHGNRRTVATFGRFVRPNWSAFHDCLGRCGLQCRAARGGPECGASLPRILSVAGSFHRQCRDDRRSGLREIGSTGV